MVESPMRSYSARHQLRRAIGLGLVTLGLIAGAGPSAGCLYPDYCIQSGISGTHTCLQFTNASALDEEGEFVNLILDGFSPPKGCDCLKNSELELLEFGDVDSLEYQQLRFGLEAGARENCLQLAIEQGASNTNCQSAEIVATTFIAPEIECTAGCFYSNPPLGGECPECVLDDDTAVGETGDSETGGEDTGTETGGGFPGLPRLQLRSGQ